MKGVSNTPAPTLPATAAFSLEGQDLNRHESGRELISAANPELVLQPTLCVEQRMCLILDVSPCLLLAANAFAGPRLEGAALSGWEAADSSKTNEFQRLVNKCQSKIIYLFLIVFQ